MIIEGDKKLIAAAFIKARAEIGGIVVEDAKGNFGKYVTLAAIAKATTGILAKHGLAIIQEAELHEGGVTIETYLLHESGATMQFSPLTMPLSKRDAQSVGSGITYGRRYQWAAICGLAPDDDDDGDAATGAKGDKSAGAQNAPRTPQTATAQHRSADRGDATFSREGQGETPPVAKGKGSEVLSEGQLKRLHAVGVELYGKEEWDTMRPKLVQAVTTGAATSSAELSPKEAEKLIEGIEKKIAQVAAMQQPTEQRQPQAA